jgi:hypothetical protein
VYTLGSGGGLGIGGYRYQITACACLDAGAVVGQPSVLWGLAAVVGWRVSSYWLDETGVSSYTALSRGVCYRAGMCMDPLCGSILSCSCLMVSADVYMCGRFPCTVLVCCSLRASYRSILFA